jgi:membrane protease YdiL (CAAX protease family)
LAFQFQFQSHGGFHGLTEQIFKGTFSAVTDATSHGRSRKGAAKISPRPWLALECGVLFVGVPLAVAARWLPVLVIPLLLVMAVGCGLTLRWRHNIYLRDLWRPQVSVGEWRRILASYLIAAAGLTGLLWRFKPDALFSLVEQHPGIWLLVMVAYPVVSVLPQELIYRAFFFERYRPLFGRGAGLPAASALVFAFGHLVFHNWPATVLTLAGGWLFARTYQRTGSLRAVAAEHALYGCAVFTIGYGQFFLDGTLRLFR